MAARRKFMKIELERVTRTDLMCIACGSFRTEWGIVPSNGSIEDAAAGIHAKCVEVIHVRHTRAKRTEGSRETEGKNA
jgi:hypothetical protein